MKPQTDKIPNATSDKILPQWVPVTPLGNTGFDLTLGSKMSVISFFLTLSLPATCLLRLETFGEDLLASGTGILVTGNLEKKG